jgi:integrase
MASIVKRKRKDGSFAYRADIRIKRGGVIIHDESQTFDRLALAKAWAAKRELELQENEAYGVQKSVLIKDLIQSYIDQFAHNYRRSKNYDLQRLLNCDIAKLDAYQLQAQHIINHCIERNKTATPQTVKGDVVWLRVVLKTMRDVEGHSYRLDAIETASSMLAREKLIAKSVKRNRRPTPKELWRLSRYFASKKRRSIPMLHIMWLAIYSARRVDEICTLKWSDNNEDKQTGMVRDLKHPTNKTGNHRRFKYPKSAWKIIQKQPRVDDRIFPFNSKTVSTYFANACKLLEIKDLHFHDLRHEAVSRLFERGLRIEQVQLISLHENWQTLRRYTNLRPEDLDC